MKLIKVNINDISVPGFLVEHEFYYAPDEINKIVSKTNHNINVYLYEGDRSYRSGNNIYININGTYWLNYNKRYFPGAEVYNLEANSFSEVLTLRCLHEIGHIQSKHTGSLDSSGNEMSKELSNICEHQAWEWAINYKNFNNIDFDKLVSSFKEISTNYPYNNKTWKDSLDEHIKQTHIIKHYKVYP